MVKELKDILLEALKGRVFVQPEMKAMYRIINIKQDPRTKEHAFVVCYYSQVKDDFCLQSISPLNFFGSEFFPDPEATPEEAELFRRAEARFNEAKRSVLEAAAEMADVIGDSGLGENPYKKGGPGNPNPDKIVF